MQSICCPQIGRFEFTPPVTQDEKDSSGFNPTQPREKWIRKRTSVKLKVGKQYLLVFSIVIFKSTW